MDPREFVEEVDLNKRLQKTDYDTLINDEKWSEQLKALQYIIDIIGHPFFVKHIFLISYYLLI